MGTVKIEYDPYKEDFMVGNKTLREFYIDLRKKSGLTIGRLQTETGLNHPILHNIEKTVYKNGRPANSLRAILIALEYLGYEIRIEKTK